MARWENLGFCPHNSVADRIHKDQHDERLIGLWGLIGPNVVCTKDEHAVIGMADNVVEMFSVDNIAYRLMTRIIRTNVNAEKISVFQSCGFACNTQRFADIQRTLTTLKDAELIIENGSKYAVVLAKGDSDSELVLYVWNLESCYD